MKVQVIENINKIHTALRCVALFIISYPALAETEISLAYLRGDAEGYLQTPAGGNPGSTTSQRPTLEELKLDSFSIYDFSISRDIGKGKHEFQIGYQAIRADSTATLQQDLTSQNRNFPAGTGVKAELQADWWRLNWLCGWCAAKFKNDAISFVPGAGLTIFDFHYQLEGGNLKADRAYAKLGYRIGGALNWQAADNFSLQLEVFEGIPISNTPAILSIDLKGKYKLWESGSIGSLVAGVSHNRIDYEDEQTVPNHIYIETGPLIRLGLSIVF